MGLFRKHYIYYYQQPTIRFWLIYALSVIFTFHTMMTVYITSSYLEQYVAPEVIGALFTIGASLAVLSFLFISRVLRRIGNVRLTLWLVFFEIIALVVLGMEPAMNTTIVAFMVFWVINPLIYLNIDIFSETLIGDNEATTGSKRGMTLMFMSIAAVIATLCAGFLVGKGTDFSAVYYTAAGIFSLFLIIVLARFRQFKDPVYSDLKVLDSIHDFWVRNDVRNVFLAHSTLQLFFSWTVVYIPLYLATVVGMSWDSIGLVIAAGLSAYVIFEYPIGLLADKYMGEKEMMAVGFLILAVSLSWITFMDTAEILPWMVLMFISRFGAALVEATSESYFFKHVDGSDANIMSFFRLTRPLAGVIGPLLGSAALLYLPFNLIFIVFGLCMVPGILFTVVLRDTK